MKNAKRLIDIKMLAEYISLPVGSLYVLASKRRLPVVKVGQRTLFDLKKIDELIEKGDLLPKVCEN